MEEVFIRLSNIGRGVKGDLRVENDDGRVVLREFTWDFSESHNLIISVLEDHTNIKLEKVILEKE